MSSRWPVIVLGIGLTVLSVWAFRSKPASNLAGANLVAGGTIIDAHAQEPLTCWDMELRLDPGIRPPGWGWILHEGRSPGEGYQLHWLETTRVLQVIRSRPVPFLLGAVTLESLPDRVTFRRRGGELSVLADSRTILHCLDPIGLPEEAFLAPRAFGCATQGTLGDALLTVQVFTPSVPVWGSDLADADLLDRSVLDRRTDTGLAMTALERRGDRAFLLTRRAFQRLDEPGDDLALLHAVARADQALTPLDPQVRRPSAGEQQRLSLWLTLARVRYALERRPEETEKSLDLIEELIQRAARDPAPERIGVLLALTEPLARRATALPEVATEAAKVALARARWLELLHQVASAARTAGRGLLAQDENARLGLLVHASACLRALPDGPPAEPRPVDAPPWLAVRWRAFAGEDPQVDELPAMPEASAPTARAIDQLATASGLAPTAALGLRRRIEVAIRQRDRWAHLGREGRDGVTRAEAEILAQWRSATVPPRERALTQALIALRLGATRPNLVVEAWKGLATDHLAERDPLAFALRLLLTRRFPDVLQATGGPEGQGQKPAAGGDDPPWTIEATGTRAGSAAKAIRALTTTHPQGMLLSGEPEARNLIWLARTPPGQALAAAMIMEEILESGTPDWSLLDLVPSLTLPLHLLQPPVERSAETDGTP